MQQLIRSGTSISANIWEAQGASSRRDFLNYYQISLKSANETTHWLVLVRMLYPKSEQFVLLSKELSEITKIIAASILSLKNKRKQ